MITYHKGDATIPLATPVILAHVCNNIGAWGAGYTKHLNKWPLCEARFRALGHQQLGTVQFVGPEQGIVIANMIAQNGIRSHNNPRPLDYEALETCLRQTIEIAYFDNADIQMPRIGCGLAGGTWNEVEQIIQQQLAFTEHDIEIRVYDL